MDRSTSVSTLFEPAGLADVALDLGLDLAAGFLGIRSLLSDVDMGLT